MHPILLYLVKMLLCSGILFGYYRVALYNERFHQWNRFYLMTSLLISMLIPLIRIPIANGQHNSGIIYVIESLPKIDIEKATSRESVIQICIVLGIAISLIFLIKLVIGFYSNIYRPYKEGEISTHEDISIIVTEKPTAPYSFFRWLFWRKNLSPESADGKRILTHELTHIQEKHSLDKLFMEFTLVIFWFNPFFWFIKKELYLIHEFLADRKAINENDGKAFAQMLLINIFPGKPTPLTNPFFSSQIKRRLHMITESKSTKFSYPKRIMALLAIFVVSFLFMLSAEKSIAQENTIESFLRKNPDAEEAIKKMLEAPIIFENRVIPLESLQAFLDSNENKRFSWSFLNEKEATKRFGKLGEKGASCLWLQSDEKKYESGLDEVIVIGRKTENNDPNSSQVSVSIKDYNLPQRPNPQVLTIVDGELKPKGALTDINPEDISEIRWINGAEAKGRFGNEGIDGAQEVFMKRSDYPMAFINLPKMPHFPGGEEAWQNYLSRELNYPEQAKTKKIEGRVVIQFKVDVMGGIYGFKILEDPGYGLGQEALRVLKQSPAWIPAQQTDKWVHAKLKIPIDFKLN
jgi:TonB family protein